MASFNSITLDLSPITDQIDQLKAELRATQERLERAEERIRDLQRSQRENPTDTIYRTPSTKSSLEKKSGGLGRGLETLIQQQ